MNRFVKTTKVAGRRQHDSARAIVRVLIAYRLPIIVMLTGIVVASACKSWTDAVLVWGATVVGLEACIRMWQLQNKRGSEQADE